MAQKVSSIIGSFCEDKYSVWYFVMRCDDEEDDIQITVITNRFAKTEKGYSLFASKSSLGLF